MNVTEKDCPTLQEAKKQGEKNKSFNWVIQFEFDEEKERGRREMMKRKRMERDDEERREE